MANVHKSKPRIIEVAFLGDPQIGKSNLITTFTSNYYSGEYTATVEYTYTSDIILGDSSTATISLHDLGGSPNHDHLRVLFLNVHTKVNAFILCFEIGNDQSIYNIKTKWWNIVKHAAKDVPIVVVGLMADKDPERGWYEEKVKEIILGADKNKNKKKKKNEEMGEGFSYAQCSTLTMKGFTEVFALIIKAATQD
ncbi:uncharacterized protein H6S33_005688 [Morchella sextelata]|uniref:uncharacterized protein n=1 Tax=Morchella sextelata TaxID=1174677 RepID=UPI001D0396E4|nr:uncharacterized protein H6S33_005688 [Morchella sextelata]KAH0613802.1 hypothetical protein H6S33_005688 [Morchella sextelata]